MCDVGKSNFAEIYPQIKENIAKATFISIDTEFTGLKVSKDDRPSLFDSGAERYRKLRNSVRAFSVSQIGLSTFHTVKCEIKGNRYEVHTYNCYLYPRTFGPLDRKFEVQASSFEFMCKHNFDFNKYIYEGVSFLNEEEEEALEKYIHSKLHGFTDRDVDEKLVQEYCSTVADWLVRSPDKTLHLTLVEDIPEYYLHIEIRQRFTNVWTFEENNMIVVQKVTEEERKKYHQEALEEQKEKIRDQMLGFTKVFRDLVAAKKPIIGHNNLMDLMYIYDKFHRPLPLDYSLFKQDIHQMFPLVFDTKNVVNNIRKHPSLEESGLLNRTFLGDLYKSLGSDKGQFHKLHSPDFVHGEDSTRYVHEHNEHEAGFDAYMAGYVFIRMAHLYAAKDMEAVKVRPFSFSEYVHALKPYANCINMIRGSIDHVTLNGPDPESRRPSWLYVRSKKMKMLDHVELAQMFAKHGSVDIQMRSSREGLVATGNYRCAKDILKAFQNHPTYYVTQYSMWRHSPVVRSIMWSGLLVSGSLCIWTLYSGLKPKTT